MIEYNRSINLTEPYVHTFIEIKGGLIMHCFRKVTEDLYWVGASDRRLELFENIFPLSDGVSYNSYLLMDEKPYSLILRTMR